MKKKKIVGIIIIALFVIGIAAALMQYKREQTALEQPEVGEEPETVVLSADENPFGVEIKKINENYDLTKNFFEIIYVFLTIFLYLLKCPQNLILSALRAFCFCGKPHISRSIFLYFRYQAWLKSW